jgi:putative phage-type endonuclease
MLSTDTNSDSIFECNILTKKEFKECIETCLELMYDYIKENPQQITEPDFEITLIEEIKELFLISFEDKVFFNSSFKEELQEDLNDIIKESLHLFYILFIPKRSFIDTFILQKPNISVLSKQLNYLSNLPQPQQRTQEWYEYRHNFITASNAYKCFETEKTMNQVIFEKCKPIIIDETSSPFTNVDSPLHWGQKYEPVSVMIYEDMFKTTISDFGCIRDEKYKFLAASPDGINTDQTSLRYGRMLEIKNIVNREIDGIPKKEYWIQMQLQMNVCNLDECDFLETRFKEYENEREYLDDGEFLVTEENERKGIIMYFANNNGNPEYIYKPLLMGKYDFSIWEQIQMEEMTKCGKMWIRNIYWRLDELSCVLVLRNKIWFQDNISQIKKVWNIIEKERIEGYDHRKPNKRFKADSSHDNTESSKCLISINKLSESIMDIDLDIDVDIVPHGKRLKSNSFLH